MLYLMNRHQAGVADHQLNVGAFRYAVPASGVRDIPKARGGGGGGGGGTTPPTPTPPPTPGSTPSVETWLGRAEALLSVFENGTTEIQYGYAEALGDGRGITAGRAGFTSGTGDLVLVVRDYVAARPGTPLAAYLPRLEELARNWSGSTAGLGGFIEDWAAAADDPVMRDIQDRIARELYFYPSQDIADEIGAALPLTRAALYGTGIQHGIGDDPDGLPAIVSETNATTGGTPGSGVDEQDWLDTFLWTRRAHLENASDPATRQVWRESVGRVDVWLDLLDRGLLQLDQPFVIWVYGGSYSIP
jgi:chitosanase